MGRGGPEIPLEADEVAAWASLTVANPKGEPSAEEREQLKAAKAAEKKGKDAVLEGVLSRLGELNKTLAEPIPLKKDKLKKALDAKAKEAAAAAEASASRPFWLDPPSGTRDFEPGDMRVRNWLFGAMRETALEFGFKEYDAPVLEHVELFERKAGEAGTISILFDTVSTSPHARFYPYECECGAPCATNGDEVAVSEVRTLATHYVDQRGE